MRRSACSVYREHRANNRCQSEQYLPGEHDEILTGTSAWPSERTPGHTHRHQHGQTNPTRRLQQRQSHGESGAIWSCRRREREEVSENRRENGGNGNQQVGEEVHGASGFRSSPMKYISFNETSSVELIAALSPQQGVVSTWLGLQRSIRKPSSRRASPPAIRAARHPRRISLDSNLPVNSALVPT